MTNNCDIFWGSHGCDLALGHAGQHLCRPCHGILDEHQAHHDSATGEEYGVVGCVGTWPYYGRSAMAGPGAGLQFFTYSPPISDEVMSVGFEDLPDEFDRLARLHKETFE